ncbi:hypothetical protein [Deinococcus sp.]|uniref:hypothetical protein n=1 Tax=Deinococcus sp. TaxID=47478 RepID=UPI003C7BE3CD
MQPVQAQTAPLPATPPAPPPACLDGTVPAVLEAALLPVEARNGDQLLGVLIVKLVGTQILARADDLGALGLDASGLQNPCTAGQYLALPGGLNPQLDSINLVLHLSLRAASGQTTDPDVLPPDSPQTTGTVARASAALVATGSPLGTLQGGQTTAVLDVETDSRLQNQQAGDGPAGAIGIRSSAHFGVQLAGSGPSAETSFSGAYLYRQSGELETDLGLLPAGAQSGLGGQQGAALVGVALHRTAAADPDAPLRLESPAAGTYRVLYRGVVLKQGTLMPGTTLVRDLLYPPVQDELTVEISDAGGTRLLSRSTVAFDHRPQSRQAGTLDYVLDAGLRNNLPSVGLSGQLATSRNSAVQAGLLLGSTRGVQLGLSLNRQGLALSADAALMVGPGGDSTAAAAPPADIQRGSLSLGLSGGQDWGSWTLRAAAEQTRAGSGLGAEVGRSTVLGLQAAVFLNRPALQVQGRLEQLDSPTGSGGPVSTTRGDLSLSGSVHLGPAAGPDADWSVRVYTSRTSTPGADSLGRSGVSVGLNLKAIEGEPGLTIQGAVQEGRPSLAVQRAGQQGDWTIDGTVRVLPIPAASIRASGPYSASLDLLAGTPPVLAANLSGTLALMAGSPHVLPSGTRQLLLVRVGVPNVQVRIGGQTALTDDRGQASLPLDLFYRQSEVQLSLDGLPLSTSFSVLTLKVQPAPNALITVADFRPYLIRTNLRQLPGLVPVGAVAHLKGEDFVLQDSRYIQLDARNGDRIAVSWPGGNCVATWSDAEVLDCRP